MRQGRAEAKATICEWNGTLFFYWSTISFHILDRRFIRWWIKCQSEQ